MRAIQPTSAALRAAGLWQALSVCGVAAPLLLCLQGGIGAAPRSAPAGGAPPAPTVAGQDRLPPSLRSFEPRWSAAQVDGWLRALHTALPGPAHLEARLQVVARARRGTPYVLGCLGEEAPPDDGPVFRLDETDCTVFVLTSLALAHGRTSAEARNWLVRFNYRDDGRGRHPVTYANRQHFTEERVVRSPHFPELTAQVAGSVPLRAVEVHLNRGHDGSPLLDIPFERRTTVRYIALGDVTPRLLARLPACIVGVAFVRRALVPKGIAIAHEGLVDGREHLIHADSVAREVRRLPLLDYLRKNRDWFDGVIFFACR